MLAKRRPTPEEAAHKLRALTVSSAKLRLYHQLRANSLCVTCEAPSTMAYCPTCAADERAARDARKDRAA
jgi:hypothetical protein